MSLLWDLETPGHCINYSDVVLALGIITVATDFLILALPIPLVWRIQISRRKKWLITFNFMLGGW